jgi:hypothetical protein
MIYYYALPQLTPSATQAWVKDTFTLGGRSYSDCMVTPLKGFNAGMHVQLATALK